MIPIIYLGISMIYLIFLFYLRSYKKPKSTNDQKDKIIQFDVVLSTHEANQEVIDLIQLILDEKISGFLRLILIEDGVSIESEVIKNTFVEVISLPENVGKVKAQRKGLQDSKADWVLLLDADVYWKRGALKNALSSTNNKKKIWALPMWEKFLFNLKFLQFEESAIKSITLKGWNEEKKHLFSSAALFVEKNFALHTMNNFDEDYGWDMYLVKKFNPQLGLVYPSEDNILLTDSKSKYSSYIKQRARWLHNGLKFNGWPLSIAGFIVFTSFILDLVVIFSLNYISHQIYFSLLSFWLIKTISAFWVARGAAKIYRQKLTFAPFFIGHLFYGLNIGIILIFLVLRRMKKFVTNGTI